MMTKAESTLIERVACRAAAIYLEYGRAVPWPMIAATLALCHTRIVPLDLPRMVEATPGNLMHDVIGIAEHLEHSPAPRLSRGFLPRYATNEEVAR